MFEQKDRDTLNSTHAALWKGGSVEIDGRVQKFNYGVLPIVVHNQTIIAQLKGEVAGLKEIVGQLTVSGGTPLDIAKIEAAAKAGAAEAVAALGVPTVEEIADAVVDEQRDRLAS